MIGMIVREEVYISTAGLIWENRRAIVVDFIDPIEQIR
jgi:hypothetical protein